MRYALVDANDIVQNLIVWDGVTPYTPSAEYRLERIEENVFCDIGWTWTSSGPQPPVEVNGE